MLEVEVEVEVEVELPCCHPPAAQASSTGPAAATCAGEKGRGLASIRREREAACRVTLRERPARSEERETLRPGVGEGVEEGVGVGEGVGEGVGVGVGDTVSVLVVLGEGAEERVGGKTSEAAGVRVCAVGEAVATADSVRSVVGVGIPVGVEVAQAVACKEVLGRSADWEGEGDTLGVGDESLEGRGEREVVEEEDGEGEREGEGRGVVDAGGVGECVEGSLAEVEGVVSGALAVRLGEGEEEKVPPPAPPLAPLAVGMPVVSGEAVAQAEGEVVGVPPPPPPPSSSTPAPLLREPLAIGEGVEAGGEGLGRAVREGEGEAEGVAPTWPLLPLPEDGEG